MEYKDMTFCTTKCDVKCFRKLTDKIYEEARNIGMPVCVGKFDCTEEQKKEMIKWKQR